MIESYSRKAVLAEIKMEIEQSEKTIELVSNKIAEWKDNYLAGNIGKRYEAKDKLVNLVTDFDELAINDEREFYSVLHRSLCFSNPF